jgi:hypothetical protein
LEEQLMTSELESCLHPMISTHRHTYTITCPICKKVFTLRIARKMLEQADHYPIAHIVVHRKPPHALLIYIDANGDIRGIEQCKSVQLDLRSNHEE